MSSPLAAPRALPRPSAWLGRPLVVIAVAWAASEGVAGSFFGFGAVASHVRFWMLAAFVVLAAFMLADRLSPSPLPSDVSIRTGLLSFAAVIGAGLVLGPLHLLAWIPYAIAGGLLVGVALLVEPRLAVRADRAAPWLSPVFLGFWTAVAAFVIGVGLGHAPYTLYDGLSYHLFFPGRWLQAHAVSIIPTPFSDEAQAYQPANGELWFLWLMLPFHGDFLARVGQLPFYALGAVTAYALARRLGAAPRHALYAPTVFLVAPPVVEQAVGANVDLIHATLFTASLYLGLIALDTDARTDWGLWGISLGLWLGTKYLALVYLPILLAVPLVRGVRRRAIWALPGIMAFGAPWYVRNWMVAGSPIYPASLTVAGLTIGRGAYSHDAMARSFLHTNDPRLLLVSLAHGYGAALFLAIVPAAACVLIAIAIRRAWWPAGGVVIAMMVAVVLCWVALGDNADSRFLLPAVVTSFSLLPLAFGTRRTLNIAVHLLYCGAIVWTLVGADASLPVALPWFMGDWLSLHGILNRDYLPAFVVLTVVSGVSFWLARDRLWTVPIAVTIAGAAAVTLAIGAETWCVPSRCDLLNVPSPHLRLGFLYGSRWLDAHAADANVAYTGINLPYPLAGSHLARVVSYVNIDRHSSWRFDDYARAFRRAHGRGDLPASALAQPSGLLMAARSHDDRIDALRPRFERMSGSRDAWRSNLDARGIRYVFIAALDPYEVDYVWHNAQGFPIEDEWARTDGAFRLDYENADVRIYEVARP